MVLAIASRRNLADQEIDRPRPCGELNPDRPDLSCVAAVGHGENHLYDEQGIWMAWLRRPRGG